MVLAIFKHKFSCFKQDEARAEAACVGTCVKNSRAFIPYFLSLVLFICFSLFSPSEACNGLSSLNSKVSDFKS